MDGRLAATLAVILFMTSVSMVIISDDADATAESTVVGVVGQQGNSGMIAADNATITFRFIAPGGTQEITREATTDADGKFSVTLPFTEEDVKVVMGCRVAGHTIFAVPECISYDDSKDEFSFTLGSLTYTSGEYVISDKLTSPIIISDAKVAVGITITGDSGPVNGAEVSLFSGTKKIAGGYSSNDGLCTFPSPILIGTYTLKITCEGCEPYMETINVTKTNTQFSANIEEKGVPTVLGLTVYHILMFFGVIIGLILVAVAYVLCSRTWKGVE
ncbi:MAG: hypothetical protein MJZ38_00425 [archaeon]|nr:hypothetical protein [archaeon]